MSPSLALSIWLVLLLSLLYYDPARDAKISAALWVPLIWFFFLGSRTPSMWIGFQTATSAAQALEEGSPLDRTIFLLLTLLAFMILVSRSFQWSKFVAQNSALFFFLAFAMISVMWSDFPLPTFKKWSRDMGIYMAVLVIVSERDRLEAVRTILRRLYYLLVPLSVVLVKYYPSVGKTYSQWGGQEYTGVATSKNMLGLLCLASGIFFFWDVATRWHQRRDKRTRRVIFVDIAFIAMAIYLLNLCGSKTSTVCLILGSLIIAAAQSNLGRRHISWLKAVAPAVFIVYLILTVGFGMGAQLSEAVGGSATMSDRTNIWKAVLTVPINPVIGCGYQSFWLGPRIQWVWARLHGDNVLEAHNGYLQTYLDLGLIGLSLVCAFLIATYRKICKLLNPRTPLGTLSLGLWSLLLLYNVTEAAFGGGLLWLTLLMGSLTLPECIKARAPDSSPLALSNAEEAAGVPFEMTGPCK